jgi:hypothetical protein
MKYTVTAYKACYSMRITVPKPIYAEFVEINDKLNPVKGGVPIFILNCLNADGGPYYDNCDFGLELYLGRAGFGSSIDNAVRSYGNSKAFVLNTGYARRLNISHGTKLECEIMAIDKLHQKQTYDKIIAYKKASGTKKV